MPRLDRMAPIGSMSSNCLISFSNDLNHISTLHELDSKGRELGPSSRPHTLVIEVKQEKNPQQRRVILECKAAHFWRARDLIPLRSMILDSPNGMINKARKDQEDAKRAVLWYRVPRHNSRDSAMAHEITHFRNRNDAY